jgi:hypothetical protein
LSAILHFAPRPFRPNLDRPEPLRKAFDERPGYGAAVSLEAESFIDFGFAGTLLAFFLLGYALRRSGSRLISPSIHHRLMGASMVVAALLLGRGSLTNASVFAVLEIGLAYLSSRWLLRRPLRGVAPGREVVGLGRLRNPDGAISNSQSAHGGSPV